MHVNLPPNVYSLKRRAVEKRVQNHRFQIFPSSLIRVRLFLHDPYRSVSQPDRLPANLSTPCESEGTETLKRRTESNIIFVARAEIFIDRKFMAKPKACLP